PQEHVSTLSLSLPLCHDVLIFLLLIPRAPKPTLFPYTTLFRSGSPRRHRLVPARARPRFDQCRSAQPRPVGGAGQPTPQAARARSEEHTSELQSRENLLCRLLLEKKKNT